MRFGIISFFVLLFTACENHSRELERLYLERLNKDLVLMEKQCFEVLTDIDETILDDVDSMFAVSGDTIWLELKMGYAGSEKRIIDLSGIIDKEELQLSHLESDFQKRLIDSKMFYNYYNKEKKNVLRLREQVRQEVKFRKQLKELKSKLKKQYQL